MPQAYLFVARKVPHARRRMDYCQHDEWHSFSLRSEAPAYADSGFTESKERYNAANEYASRRWRPYAQRSSPAGSAGAFSDEL